MNFKERRELLELGRIIAEAKGDYGEGKEIVMQISNMIAKLNSIEENKNNKNCSPINTLINKIIEDSFEFEYKWFEYYYKENIKFLKDEKRNAG